MVLHAQAKNQITQIINPWKAKCMREMRVQGSYSWSPTSPILTLGEDELKLAMEVLMLEGGRVEEDGQRQEDGGLDNPPSCCCKIGRVLMISKGVNTRIG